jgi:PAS domain-containing protein
MNQLGEKNTIKELRQTLAWMDLVLANITEGICVIDQNQAIIYTNDAFTKLVDQQRIKLLGLKLPNLIPFKQEKIQPGVYQLKTTRGNTSISLTTKDISNINQQVIVIKDITLAEQTKIKLEQYKKLYDSNADAIMTLEPPTWGFTSGNPAAIKLFNTKDEKEFTSLGPQDFSPEKQPDGQLSGAKAKLAIEKAMKDGSNFFEWIHKKYQGENFATTVLLTKVTHHGKEFLQATVRDISKQKQAEESLKTQTQELEKMNKLMVGRELKMIELKDQNKKLLDLSKK